MYKAFCFRYREILGAALQNQLRKKCLYKQSVLVATLNPPSLPSQPRTRSLNPCSLAVMMMMMMSVFIFLQQSKYNAFT